MSKLLITLAGLLLGAILLGEAQADERGLRFESGPNRVALLELYTSEGCNSCPPADRWLSSLKRNPELWKTVAPIAFHVDYWDYIGWKDRFAQAEFGERQSRYASEGGSRFVYTPGLFRNGKDWQGWRRDETEFANDEQAGTLFVELVGTACGSGVSPRQQIGPGRPSHCRSCACPATAKIEFVPSSESQETLTAHIAVLGMNRVSKVEAGENVGKILRQDFVALEIVSSPLAIRDDYHVATVEFADSPFDRRDVAVVAWVSGSKTQAPLQAAGISIPAAFEAER